MKKKNPGNRAALKVLSRLIPKHIGADGLGDFQEIYLSIFKEKGPKKADFWLWSQIFSALLIRIREAGAAGLGLFSDTLKIFWRHLTKSKVFSAVNISGLAVGIACCLLIFLYVTDELSFDGFHQNKDRIHRLISFSKVGGVTRSFVMTPAALAPAVADSIPEVEDFTRLLRYAKLGLRYQDKDYEFPNVFFADANFFRIFSHEFVSGNPDSALGKPNAIVLTEATAKRLFGETDPLGKVINTSHARQFNLVITGVIKNIPGNSHYQFDYLISLPTLGQIENDFSIDNKIPRRAFLDEDFGFNSYSYLLLKESAERNVVEAKISTVVDSSWGGFLEHWGVERSYLLQPLKDVHLKSNFEGELTTSGNINHIYSFSAIAILILFIACFNFINLSTARAGKRAKEIGLRKIFGAVKRQLIKQFIAESSLTALLGLLLGILLVLVLLPFFNDLTQKTFAWRNLLTLNAAFTCLAIIIITGFFAGSFPAVILSSFNPSEALTGQTTGGSKTALLRKILVLAQFSISILLIIAVVTILAQMNYIKNKPLGFAQDHILVIPENTQPDQPLRERLLQYPGVASISMTISIPGRSTPDIVLYLQGGNPRDSVRGSWFFIDENFLECYGIELVQGRNFSSQYPGDPQVSALINQQAARELGIENNAVGTRLTYEKDGGTQSATVIGIVRDFHHNSMKLAVNPVFFTLIPDANQYISIRIKPQNTGSILSYLNNVWAEIHPEKKFDYYFIDEDFRKKYPEEEKLQLVVIGFGSVSILIACLGLFGLTAFSVERRTKEIGIRKVLGANSVHVMTDLSKEFLKWVLVANILAWPIGHLLINRWLNTFAYRVNLHLGIFFAAGSAALLTAFITISYHTVKCALSNPVTSLRHE